MKHIRIVKPGRLFTEALIALLFAVCAFQPNSQAASSGTRHPQPIGYDKAHEVTLNSTIQEVVLRSAHGSPVGVHLLVVGSQGLIDAHLGPYLTRDTQEALRSGQPVQIIGAMEKVHGKNYLLVRQLIFGGRLVTVRSERGFLLRTRPSPLTQPNTAGTTKQVDLTGGGL